MSVLTSNRRDGSVANGHLICAGAPVMGSMRHARIPWYAHLIRSSMRPRFLFELDTVVALAATALIAGSPLSGQRGPASSPTRYATAPEDVTRATHAHFVSYAGWMEVSTQGVQRTVRYSTADVEDGDDGVVTFRFRPAEIAPAFSKRGRARLAALAAGACKSDGSLPNSFYGDAEIRFVRERLSIYARCAVMPPGAPRRVWVGFAGGEGSEGGVVMTPEAFAALMRQFGLPLPLLSTTPQR